MAIGDDVDGAYFGWSVSSAGDVNRDGYDDVIVGAPGFELAASPGRAFIYYGGPSGLATTAGWSAQGDGQADSRFGYSVTGGGDSDGDGYDDVFVGAISWDSSSRADLGGVFGYAGDPAGPVSAWFAGGTFTGVEFGIAITIAGDANDDGYADLLVGTRHANAAFVYLGGPTGPPPVWSHIFGGPSGGAFGYALSYLGDINGDGFHDVIVGAPGRGFGGEASSNLGRAGGVTFAPWWWRSGDPQPAAYFGLAVSGGGDVNGDGTIEVLVASPTYDQVQPDAGRVDLYCLTP